MWAAPELKNSHSRRLPVHPPHGPIARRAAVRTFTPAVAAGAAVAKFPATAVALVDLHVRSEPGGGLASAIRTTMIVSHE